MVFAVDSTRISIAQIQVAGPLHGAAPPEMPQDRKYHDGDDRHVVVAGGAVFYSIHELQHDVAAHRVRMEPACSIVRRM